MPATMDRESIAFSPHQIVCPLAIQNRSDEVLVFEKLCLRPRHLGLYSGSTHLWSSIVRIQHEGIFMSTNVRYTADKPDWESGLLEITRPQRREEKGLQRLTFGSAFSRDIIFSK